ncbi:MAG: SPFH domain-containing protein [Ktedonobacteraceae bacterium]
MGLLHFLADRGIKMMDNTEKDLKAIGQRLGYMPLSWRQVIMTHPDKDGLLWRLPDPQVPMASSLSRIQSILVSEYERAIVLKDGMLTEQVVLPPGLYDISRTVNVRGQIEIIWTTTSEFQLRWGIPDVITGDRVSVGASGFFSAAIIDPETFLRNVGSSQQVFKKENMATFAKPEVDSLLRELIAHKTVMEFQLARQEFIGAAREALQPIFERWGLEFRGLTIENQRIPEKFREAAERRTIVSMEKEAQIVAATEDVNLAQLEAQKQYYLSQADASKYYITGSAEVENMRRQLSIGLDPLKLKMAAAMEILAATPSEGSLVDGRVQVMNYLSGSLNTVTGGVPPTSADTANAALGQPIGLPAPATAGGVSGRGPNTGLSSDSANTGGFAPFIPPDASNPLGTGALAAQVSLSQPTTTGGMTREKIKEMLDKLDERLIAGEITEQKHSELYDRLQKKLSELP